ncbi:MAG: DMT family transporter [Pseudomonadota bacterium]
MTQQITTTNKKPILEITIGASLLSFSAVFVRLTHTGPLTDAFYRMFFGGIFLLIIVLFRRDSMKLNFDALKFIFLAGLFFGVDLMFWHSSINKIGPGLATVLVNLQVFILTLFSVLFYKENFAPRYLIALPLAMLGLYLLIGYEWGRLNVVYKSGIYECLIATIWYSLYILALRKTQQVKNPLPIYPNLCYVCFASAAVLAIAMGLTHVSFKIDTVSDFSMLVAYGLFAQVFGWLLISKGLPKVTVAVAGFLLLLQPSFSMLWDIIFFHRPTPPIQITGALLTLLAIYLVTTSKTKPLK